MNFFDKISGFFENMTPKGLLAMSLVAGLLAFFLVFMALSGKNETASKDKADLTMVKVVTAKTDIPLRGEIKEEMLRVMELPQSAVPEDAIKEITTAVGKPAKVAIMNGDIITSRKLFPDKRAAGFPGMIPEDCRAITLPIDDVTGVAGFALPGDYVDVMLVSEKLKDGSVTGEVVMQNVLLLGINKLTEGGPVVAVDNKDKDKKEAAAAAANAGPKPVDAPVTATLAVHPEEAMRLSVASQVGKLYLALRPFRPTNRYIIDTSYQVNFEKRNEEKRQTPTPASAPAPAASAPAPSYSAPANGGNSGSAPKAASSPKVDRGVAEVEVIRGVASTKE